MFPVTFQPVTQLSLPYWQKKPQREVHVILRNTEPRIEWRAPLSLPPRSHWVTVGNAPGLWFYIFISSIIRSASCYFYGMEVHCKGLYTHIHTAIFNSAERGWNFIWGMNYQREKMSLSEQSIQSRTTSCLPSDPKCHIIGVFSMASVFWERDSLVSNTFLPTSCVTLGLA